MLAGAETRYHVEAVVRACKILSAFRSEDDRPRLQELAERANLNRSTALRLLRTLESCGFVARTSAQRYRCLVHQPRKADCRIGYAVDSLGKSFRQEVSDGLEQAAAEHGVELIAFDDRGDKRSAVRVAEAVIRAKVDLVIDFQTGYEVGPVVAAKYLEAGIPCIAVDTPHPGATFFGVNNYVAGRDGGRWLAGWVRENWQGNLDAIVLVAAGQGGVISSRVRGAVAGLQEKLKSAASPRILELPTNALFEPSFRAVRALMNKIRRGRILILEPADPGVMGAVMALEEAGSSVEAAVFGFGGNLETRLAIREPRSRLIGCVGFCPETYGRQLIPAALRLLEGKTVPPALFIEHQIITRDNVDLLYPNDHSAASVKMTV
ncbi:MAG: substrate-binding domain-containing protein [Acidobacteria bacterium]|nr:substrate-binding domain-containing protein [Acidobacteriota bacterium]